MFWFIYIFSLGLIVGSFANVVSYRVPRGESVVMGGSLCIHCRKKIAWFDLIPIVSFFILRFRCRQCRRSISWLYPAVELYSGIIFLSAFRIVGLVSVIDWLFLVLILESLLILALIDFKNLILPDSVMLVMFLGVLGYWVWERLFGKQGFNIFSFNNFIGAAILFSALFLLWFLSSGKWLGFGDVKLAGIIGLIFGLWGGLIIIYGAVIAGIAVGLILLVSPAPVWMAQNWGWTSRRANLKTKLPLGTLISFSATVYVFFGQGILEKLKPFFFSVPFIFR